MSSLVLEIQSADEVEEAVLVALNRFCRKSHMACFQQWYSHWRELLQMWCAVTHAMITVKLTWAESYW